MNKLFKCFSFTVITLFSFSLASCGENPPSNIETEEKDKKMSIRGDSTFKYEKDIKKKYKAYDSESDEVLSLAKFTSLNLDIFTITENGSLTPLKVGKGFIQAELEHYEKANFSIEITLNEAHFEVEKTTYDVDDKFTFKILDSDNKEVSNINVVSSDEEIGTINESSEVTCLKEGVFTISFDDEFYGNDSIDINVNAKVLPPEPEGNVSITSEKCNFKSITPVKGLRKDGKNLYLDPLYNSSYNVFNDSLVFGSGTNLVDVNTYNADWLYKSPDIYFAARFKIVFSLNITDKHLLFLDTRPTVSYVSFNGVPTGIESGLRLSFSNGSHKMVYCPEYDGTINDTTGPQYAIHAASPFTSSDLACYTAKTACKSSSQQYIDLNAEGDEVECIGDGLNSENDVEVTCTLWIDGCDPNVTDEKSNDAPEMKLTLGFYAILQKH